MPRPLPPLATLRAFEAVARLGSVTRAAEELNRTHSAVSHQLRNLHDLAGLSFFDKEGAGLRLNRHGAALHKAVAQAFEDLGHAWERVLEDARSPSLHVACSATFAMRWLVPRLGDFYRAHPETRLRLSMTSAREIRHQGADILIAWDRAALAPLDPQGAIELAPVRFGPVCAPGYPLETGGGPLRFETRIAHAFTARSWDEWQRLSGLRARWRQELAFPHTHLCTEAAAAGLGVALAEERMVAEALRAGQLHAPHGFTALGDRLTALPANERGRSNAAEAFIAWLARGLEENP